LTPISIEESIMTISN